MGNFKMGEGDIVEKQENTLNSFYSIHPIPFFISGSASAYRWIRIHSQSGWYTTGNQHDFPRTHRAPKESSKWILSRSFSLPLIDHCGEIHVHPPLIDLQRSEETRRWGALLQHLHSRNKISHLPGLRISHRVVRWYMFWVRLVNTFI